MLPYFMQLRELLKKKCSLIMDFFQKGGGGDPRQSKSFGTLFLHQQGGGGWTKSKKIWALFTLILVKYDTKSVPKVPQKKISLRKSVPKVPKVWGGVGGVRPFWKKSTCNLHFFFEKLPYPKAQRNIRVILIFL